MKQSTLSEAEKMAILAEVAEASKALLVPGSPEREAVLQLEKQMRQEAQEVFDNLDRAEIITHQDLGIVVNAAA